MAFTLKIVFYGLIAFIPDSDNKGLTAILLDEVGHESKVSFYQGYCDSGACPPYWNLSKVDLNIIGLPALTKGKEMAGLAFPRLTAVSGFPVNANDMRSLKWVPRMEAIEYDASAVKSDCLKSATSCPVAARVRLEGQGAASSCHFLHTENDKDDLLVGFFFAAPGQSAVQHKVRAIADAIEAEFSVEDIYLEEAALANPSMKGRRVKLTPVDGKVVLLITNQPLTEPTRSDLHFLSYYKLSRSGSANINGDRFHHRATEVTHAVDEAGSCEEIVSTIVLPALEAPRKQSAVYVPHNKAECDAVLFLPEPDA